MKYSFKSRIRYSETDSGTHLTFPAMMDYFQDTSTFHGEDNGLPLTLLYKERIAWVLSGWQVRIFKNVSLNDIATFTTWAYGFRGNIGLRNYSLTNEAGELCAAADSQYVLIDIDKQLPTRITEQLVNGYTIEPEAHIDMRLSRKIRPFPEAEYFDAFAVKDYMLDTNKHMNNSQYIKMALEFIPSDFKFNCFRAEYKKQTRAGDVLTPCRAEADGAVQVRFYDSDDGLRFIAEWTYDPAQKGEYHA